jgi:hypothetical protein
MAGMNEKWKRLITRFGWAGLAFFTLKGLLYLAIFFGLIQFSDCS